MIYIDGTPYDTNKPTALFENLLTEGTLTGTEDSDFPKENAITGSTWDYWQAPDATTRSLGVSLATSEYADCCFIASHDIANVGADIRVRYSADGGTTWVNASDWYTPEDNSSIMILFDGATGNSWQLQTRNGPPKIAVVMIGQKLAFEYGISDNRVGFKHGETVDIMGGNSLGGHFLGQKVRRKGGEISVQFPWLTSDWVDNDMLMFEDHYNSGKPFGFAGNPAYDADDLGYCWRGQRNSELSPSYIEGGIAASMTMGVNYYVAT